ncbi:MAG TPA: hypothetical protein DDY71_16510 [Spirochaetia bacterium]|nr:hypothetical protein [Spirochaetia bacterium]HBI39246.1 hypothetical protein [Spirochaetia bacterium]
MPYVKYISRVFFLLAIMLIVFLIKSCLPVKPDISILYFFVFIVAISFSYILFYLITEGHLSEIIVGVLISVVLTILAVVFPPAIVLLFIYFIYSIIRIVGTIFSLIGMATLSGIFYFLLFNDFIFGYRAEKGFIFSGDILSQFLANEISLNSIINTFMNRSNATLIDLCLIAVCVFIAFRYAYTMSIKDSLFKFSFFLLVIPIMILLIQSLKSSIENLFEMRYHFNQEKGFKAVKVESYFRTDGTEVSAYTKHLPQVITTMSTQQVAGIGAGIAGATATSMSSISNAINTIDNKTADANALQKINDEAKKLDKSYDNKISVSFKTIMEE